MMQDSGSQKISKVRIAVVVYGVVIILVTFLFIIIKFQQNKDNNKIKIAARAQVSDAEVRNVVVSNGFAVATINSPSSNGQLKSGNIALFKENDDKSMTQIASGSSFNTIDFLDLGVPLTTQAKLLKKSLEQIKQDLADSCNYNNTNTPGYMGFNGSFHPNGWGIDASKLFFITNALDSVVSDINSGVKSDNKVICVNATTDNSNLVIDRKRQRVNYTIQVKFITNSGGTSAHTLNFSNNGNNSWDFILDGRKINTKK